MRLLINYTRNVGPKTDDDEVSEYWIGEGGYKHLIHKKSRYNQCQVLVIQGEYTDNDLPDIIEEAVSQLDSDSEVGVLYHYRISGSDYENDIRSELPDVEYTFLSNYSGSDPTYQLYTNLAKACREGGDFGEEFDALWDHYRPDESLELKLDLLHELLVPPADKEEITAKGKSLIEGVRDDPDESEEDAKRCEEALEVFINADPQQYSDDPFNEEYCGSEDKEGILEKLRDGLLPTAS